jgi:hypothetical protein
VPSTVALAEAAPVAAPEQPGQVPDLAIAAVLSVAGEALYAWKQKKWQPFLAC